MRGEVVDAINKLPERSRFVRGLRSWGRFQADGSGLRARRTFAGEPKCNLRKLMKLGIEGIVNFSYRPLQFIMFIGLSLAGLCLFGAIFVAVQYITNWTIIGFNPRNARGWTSAIFIILFLSSANPDTCAGILWRILGPSLRGR